MAQTRFDICNAALITVGCNLIASFEDGSVEASFCARRYEGLARHHLSAHRWRFATEQALLVRREDVPADARWTFAYQEPADLLTLHGVTLHGRPIEYDRLGQTIFTRAGEGLVASYTWRADESRWHPTFVEAFTMALAAVAMHSLRENATAADDLDSVARGLFGVARLVDSQQQTARRMPVGRLIAVRR